MSMPDESTVVLGIETSCDETAAAIVADGRVIKSSVVASQTKLHEKYGGVVPEIASRAHIEKIYPVIASAIEEAGLGKTDLDAIAIANQPGAAEACLADLEFDTSVYLPGLLEPGTVDGELYFLPKDYSTLAVYYNKTLFDEAGVEYPQDGWTWDDFLSAATTLSSVVFPDPLGPLKQVTVFSGILRVIPFMLVN